MGNGSIERRVVISATVAMAATILGSGALIFEAYQSGARSDGEQAIANLLGLGAERAVAESVFASRTGDKDQQTHLGAEAEESMTRQQTIEEADNLSFPEFVKDYLSI